MDTNEDNIKIKVWTFLDKMEPGDRYWVKNLSTPDNLNKLIFYIKQYMNEAGQFQGDLNFNKDYTIIYKNTPVTFKK